MVTVDVPNIFSPNNDGINDFWNVDLMDFKDTSLFIYDRWGKLVKSSQDEYVDWDGLFKISNAIVGVYVFSLTYTDQSGITVQRYGDITLMR